FRRAAEFERGRIYDSLVEPDAAFRHFSLGHALSPEIQPNTKQLGQAYLDELDRLCSRIGQAGILRKLAAATQTAGDAGPPPPVFLLGFVRSGTTLMDTILQIHPQVIVLEEEPTIDVVLQAAQALPGGYPDCLAMLAPTQLATLRSLYWKTVTGITGPLTPEIRLIDKFPLNSVHAPLMYALFPEARFLFALRHPCDVVLSSFMQMFGPGGALANFSTLEGGATMYAKVMELWIRYLDALPLRVHTLRYEDLVADTDRTMTDALDFLGLETRQTLRHTEKAKQRGRIYTPSYHQVIQPIYRDALGRWQRYQKYFGRALGILQPFADRFGYTI
ncbi:MAG: sulfotransferase family protein, partial [Gammaproteobacteria bacterium]